MEDTEQKPGREKNKIKKLKRRTYRIKDKEGNIEIIKSKY